MTTYLESLQNGLLESFMEDDRVLLLGEDISDPYGGAFKVSRGLSTRYPDRVINTPISEAGFTGVAGGMAIRGLRPVVEIMFGDFLTLCTDQIVNHITKFASMYPGVSVPLVIRTPMGGGRGYGATHSQTLEKMFLGVPGLLVVAPSLAHDPGKLLKYAILKELTPVLFLENKSLYSQKIAKDSNGPLSIRHIEQLTGYPTAVVRNLPDAPPDACILSYGGASRLILEIMSRYIAEEISIKAIFPSQLNTAVRDDILQEVRGCSSIIIVEEGSAGFNWGSEFAAMIYDKYHASLNKPIIRLAAKDSIIPCAKPLEDEVLINEAQLESAILEILS